MAARKTKLNFSITHLPTLLVIAVAACSDATTGFYPLEAGRWWYYRTETTILDNHREQRFLVANLGHGTHEGENVFIQRQSTGREIYFRHTSRGIERVSMRVRIGEPPTSQEPTLIFPESPELAGDWTTQSGLALIESRTFARQDKLRNVSLPIELTMSVTTVDDTVSVPAGRFKSCVRLDGTGTRNVKTDRGNATAEVVVTHQEWYAPGIGLIKTTRSETSTSPFLKPGHFTQELLRFKR